jgi:dienelactone hydrolase
MLAGLAVSLILMVLGIGALFGVLWLDHNHETTLPTPTGPFAVGRTAYVWSDPAQTDRLAPEPGVPRTLFTWIWYPASSPQPSQTAEDYMPAHWRTALERHAGVLLTRFLTRDLSRVRTHSFRDAELSPKQPSYPVALMRAGLAKLTLDYTTLAEDLASHGYVVVGFDAPYRTMVVVERDGSVVFRTSQNDADLVTGAERKQLADKLVHAWSADMSFALDQLERLNASDPSGRFLGRLDLQRVGAFGHSLGGATALQFCHDDSRCKAGVDVDGAPLGSVVGQGVTQPFMFVMGEHNKGLDPEVGRVQADVQSIYDRLPPDDRAMVKIRGANHFLFSDGALLKAPVILSALNLLRIVGIDGRRQLALTSYCVRSFFDAYVKRADASTFNIASPLYPEIKVLG